MQTEVNYSFATELAQLESLGFNKKSQNLALLRRTNGNVEVVVKFLAARKEFRDSISETKKGKKFLKKEYKKCKKIGTEDAILEDAEEDLEKSKDEKKRIKKEIKLAEKRERAEKKFFKKQSDTSGIDKKTQKKLEKEARRLEKQQQKMEKKQHRAEEKKYAASLKELPPTIHTVYLDGNNMLFVLGALRNRVIRRNVKEAEQLFEMMAKTWQQSTPQLNKCVLIFDDTKTFREDEHFKVCSARPTFPTSDHALIQWAEDTPVTERANVAVFTSDRALTEQLEKIGVQVFKSKMWFNVAANALKLDENSNEVPSLDAWADMWLAKQLEEMNVN
eukprot:TRINITY_DN67659_c0_g1_i7.p1 TRINITY_DN67659_c0_g1~~TRINITY_DN67659_c0_g1_i7.p1  ORF type:complete len:333 (-),score=151.64 TRINITY_DN67659_c0_g1_i7:55-1053(-)